jgi:NADH-quinone oxidoreductase subunit G
MGYGRDISRFAERKRVVKDKSLGPLVSTDMTRCIQCTRCVRFGIEIQGHPQLGTTHRGEHMQIETYVEQALDHELSANIIDLCPVGALNNKPFRYHARAWEMTQRPLVSPHDAFGTNIFAHVLQGKLMRVVPRENEEINETWIADRDRFGFEGMYGPERVTQPMVRLDGALKPVDWEVALTAAAEGLQKVAAAHGASRLGFLASPSATVEETYLLARVARGLGSTNVDHRLRQLDFRADARDAAFPSLGRSIADIELLDGVLVVGSNLRQEMPMLAHRLRKAAQRGAKVAFLNPRRFEYMFPVAYYAVAGGQSVPAPAVAGGQSVPASALADDLVGDLAATVRAAAASGGQSVPAGVREAAVTEVHRTLAAALNHGETRAVVLGTLAQRHPAYAELKTLAAALARLTGASVGFITEGANSAGAYLAGAVPHRESGGAAAPAPGLSARAMIESRLKGYVLFGGIDPAEDLPAGAGAALAAADFVLAATSHLPASLAAAAHVVLPVGTFAEGSGTFVNFEGRWQSWAGATNLVGESRPGWKVLRVLANLLNVPNVEYMSSEEIRDELRQLCGERLAPTVGPRTAEAAAAELARGDAAAPGEWTDIPLYQVDVLVRGSESLAKTKDGHLAREVL